MELYAIKNFFENNLLIDIVLSIHYLYLRQIVKSIEIYRQIVYQNLAPTAPIYCIMWIGKPQA